MLVIKWGSNCDLYKFNIYHFNLFTRDASEQTYAAKSAE